MPDRPHDPAPPEMPASVILCGLGIMALVIGVSTWVIWGFLPDSFRDSVWYSVKYDVSRDRVHEDKRPADCDWGHAPIGDKGCHYDQQIETLKNDRGVVTDVFVGWNKVTD